MPKRKNESTEFDYFLKRADYWLDPKGNLTVRRKDARLFLTLQAALLVQQEYEEGAVRIVRIPRK